MIPNGTHPMTLFAMNNDQSLPNSQMLQQQSSTIQQNLSAHWQQQPQFAIPPTQQMPTLDMLAQQPQFNQLQWANQMPQTAMLQMAPFNMPLISQQIIQEALAMSQPVIATDEPTLLTALLTAKKTNRNFKEAINGLHGTNGHSASLWKDYYLEHKERFDDWIEMCIKKEKAESPTPTNPTAGDTRKSSGVTVKKPLPASFKHDPSLPLAAKSSRLSHSGSPVTLPSRGAKKSSPLVKQFLPVEGRGRKTMNSLSVAEPIFGNGLPPPNACIKVPDPPSRSPSPPANVVFQGRGNRYTQEDREYFIKFISWRLKQNSSLSRHELCEMLAEKAPHHTSLSWTSFWSNNHDVPDKIFAAARGEIQEEKELHRDEEISETRRPNYKEMTTSDEEQSKSESEESDEDDIYTEPLRRYSEEDMGRKGDSFKEADAYFMAKYIASTPDWEHLKHKDRWDPYHEKYPQRSAKSWAELYRNHELRLSKLAQQIKRETVSSSILAQCARPSKVPPKEKRKLDDEGEVSEHKRSKLGVE